MACASVGMDQHVIHPRLAEIAADLAISEAQQQAWEVFVETFDAIERTVEAIDARMLRRFPGRAPPLGELLRVQVDALTTRAKATRLLKAITDSLYRALTPGQRERADQLLPDILQRTLRDQRAMLDFRDDR